MASAAAAAAARRVWHTPPLPSRAVSAAATSAPPARSPHAAQTLLAADRRPARIDLRRSVAVDRARRGAVVAPGPAGVVRRAEPGPAGALVLEAGVRHGVLSLGVWGPAATPPGTVERALAAAAAWCGEDDDVDGFAELAGAHPVTRALVRHLGPVRLSRVPRVDEALGRAVLAQLVTGVEAARSTAQVAALVGTPARSGLWCWPSLARLGATPAWTLRRCGVSLKSAVALHAAASDAGRLGAAARDWPRLDRRLRALRGVGPWTSAETRLALGDADAVSVGDYNLPSVVGHALGDGPTDDAGMLTLLAPFRPHRGRVVRLLAMGMAAGLLARPPRRAPRARLSAHRYW